MSSFRTGGKVGKWRDGGGSAEADLAPDAVMDEPQPLISMSTGRSAVRRALWFTSAFCILMSVMLMTGAAAYLGLEPARVLWVWIGLQPDISTLGLVLAMLAAAVVLLFAFRRALRLNVVED
jgi:hypothetical protein